MTDKQFHALMIDPRTGEMFEVWLREDARSDAERAERAQWQRNEELVIRYLRSHWRAEAHR